MKKRDANRWEKGDHSGVRFDLCTVYGHNNEDCYWVRTDTALNRQINRVEELNLRGGGEIFNDSDSDDINESSGNDIDDIYAVTVMTAVDCDDISCGDGGDVRQRYG